ncbi:MAG: hypothetical protein ACJA1R_001960 [Flavobacteriales bacterium]|jgi:hypothetical protein
MEATGELAVSPKNVGNIEVLRVAEPPLRFLTEEPVSNFEFPERASLALLSSATVDGCEPMALRVALSTILANWGESPHRNRLLAFHLGLAELMKEGAAWKAAAASRGILMNDIAEEEDGFVRLIRERWEKALQPAVDEAREQGIEQGIERVLKLVRTTMPPEDLERFAAALETSSDE